MLYGASGWVDVDKTEDRGRGDNIEALPLGEMVKVTGNAKLLFGTLFQGKLYNGSSYYLRELTITITAKEKSGANRWSRQFKDKVFIDTLTTGDFQIEVTGAEGAALTWSIDEVKGEKRK